MKNYRQDRVADQILRDASEIIHREIKDNRIGFITLSRVKISSDLKYATIYYTVLGSEEDVNKTKTALGSNRGLIQSKLGGRLGLRNTPEITFEMDKGIEHSLKVNEILKKIEDEKNQRDD
ncbi:MAG: 30S ribosome-binding factor RbfA [candidate division Zixibacteria bacterium]|nr:30S ribosome-binding factor RbfA [candidate division Zixibacteria bacterium]